MSLNCAIVSATDAADTLAAAWRAQSDGQLTASWMLHGRPGVGKTDVVRGLADSLGARLFDLRLTNIEPQDLRGLPYYDHDAKRTIWYRPEDLPDDPNTPSILFLDELTAASPYLHPVVYGLLQERRVGRHTLPDSVLIIAAGNTIEDGAVAYEMGTALSDRLIHLHLRANAKDWLEHFAVTRALHPAVTAFIRSRPDLLETSEDSLRRGETIACTPRAWERVSAILGAIADRRTRQIMIAGTVGEAAAAEFAIVADDIEASVHVARILAARGSDRAAMYPTSLNGLVALIYGILGALDKATIGPAIDVMAEIRHLARLRPDAGFESLPLGELSAFGFELLIRKALQQGLQEAFRSSRAYAEYATDREAAGLA